MSGNLLELAFLLRKMPQPAQQTTQDLVEGRTRQCAKSVQRVDGRKGSHTLHQKRSRFEKRNPRRNFERRSAQTSRVWDDRYQRLSPGRGS